MTHLFSLKPADSRTLMTLFSLSFVLFLFATDQVVVHVQGVYEQTMEVMKKSIHFPHEELCCGRDSEWEATIAKACHR